MTPPNTTPSAWPAGTDAHAAGPRAWMVALLMLAWLAATAWVRPLLLPDEGRYVGVAWEMLRSGDWLTPQLDGMPFFHKPPLFYWLTAASMALFGPHEWAARAASLLGAWGAGWALYLFLRRWAGGPQARSALMVLAVQPMFFIAGQFANLDMLVAGCITATVLCGAHAALCLEQQQAHKRALAGAWALAALGVLAKGLIGIVIPALVLLVWLLARGRWRLLPRLLWAPGVLLFLGLAAPWFWAMQTLHPGFLNYFFVVQHFKRFASGGFNNVQPFWFFPAVLLLVSLPWLPWTLRRMRQAGRPWRPNPLQGLMLAWVAVVLVFFSLPASKLLGYVLPALPPLACLMADGLGPRWPRGVWLSAVISALVGLGLIAELSLHPPRTTRPLATALAAVHQGREPVFALGFFPYDLPFYARLQAPITVVDDWADTSIGDHDNWRKELADAAGFAPAHAASTLISAAALPSRLCQAGSAWVLAAPDTAARYAFLAQAERVFAGADATLWRVDRRQPLLAAALNCR